MCRLIRHSQLQLLALLQKLGGVRRDGHTLYYHINYYYVVTDILMYYHINLLRRDGHTLYYHIILLHALKHAVHA